MGKFDKIMKKYLSKVDIEFRHERKITVLKADIAAVIRSLRPFGRVVFIDGREVLDTCENCGCPFFATNEYITDLEGTPLCLLCAGELARESGEQEKPTEYLFVKRNKAK